MRPLVLNFSQLTFGSIVPGQHPAAGSCQQLQRFSSPPLPRPSLSPPPPPPPPPPRDPHIRPCHLFNPAARRMLMSCLHTFVGASSKASPILCSLQLIVIRSFRLRVLSPQHLPIFPSPCTILSLKSTRTLFPHVHLPHSKGQPWTQKTHPRPNCRDSAAAHHE